MKALIPLLALLCFLMMASKVHGLNLEHLHGSVAAEAAAPSDDLAAAQDELDWLNLFNHQRLEKRKKFHPSDPRSLFTAIYSNYPYSKRYSDQSYWYPKDAADLKRGLSSPLDPRNLFRAVYGYRK